MCRAGETINSKGRLHLQENGTALGMNCSFSGIRAGGGLINTLMQSAPYATERPQQLTAHSEKDLSP